MSFQILVTSIFNSRSHKFIILLGSNFGFEFNEPTRCQSGLPGKHFPLFTDEAERFLNN